MQKEDKLIIGGHEFHSRFRKTFWISFLKMLPCCPIPPAQEMLRKQSALQDWQESWAVVIS